MNFAEKLISTIAGFSMAAIDATANACSGGGAMLDPVKWNLHTTTKGQSFEWSLSLTPPAAPGEKPVARVLSVQRHSERGLWDGSATVDFRELPAVRLSGQYVAQDDWPVNPDGTRPEFASKCRAGLGAAKLVAEGMNDLIQRDPRFAKAGLGHLRVYATFEEAVKATGKTPQAAPNPPAQPRPRPLSPLERHHYGS